MKPPKKQKPLDPYKVLGLARDVSQNDIKKTYFTLVREFPPEEQPEKFKEIRAAYEVLRSPEKRAETDLFLLQAPSTPPKHQAMNLELDIKDEDMIALAFELGNINLSWSKEFEEPKL